MVQKKYGWRIVGFVFRGLFTALIIGIVGLLAWRIIDRDTDPKIMKTITPNTLLCSAYEENDGDLTLYKQTQNEYTQEDSNYGYFANGGCVYIDEAKQMQFVLRYNNSTLKYTARDYDLKYYEVTDLDGKVHTFPTHDEALEAARKIDPEKPGDRIEGFSAIPSRDENIYDVTLLVMYDLTPDNDEDNDGNTPEAVRYERIQPTGDQITFRKTLYNYRKFIFDGVELGDNVLAVYADIYYVDDLDYNDQSYGTLLLYYYDDEIDQVELTKADRRAIEDFN